MRVFTGIFLVGLIAVSYGGSVSPKLTRIKGRDGDAAGRTLLRKQIFNDYDKVNIPDDVTVKFGVSLVTLDVDDERGLLNLGSWLKYSWIDSRLKWDNKTTGINTLRLGHDEIWKPDITLYNGANINKNMMDCWDSNPILNSDGMIIWVPPCQIESYCNFTTDKYPYGVQKCDLKFGSWTYDADLLDLDFIGDTKGLDLGDFGNEEWKITETTGVRHEKIYPCCPDTAYVDLTYSLKFQRHELNTC